VFIQSTVKIHYNINTDPSTTESSINETSETHFDVTVNVGAGSYPIKKGESDTNLINKIITIDTKNGSIKLLKIDDRSECYGGYTYKSDGNHELVGSTAAWNEYLKVNHVQNQHIFYVPVWLHAVKPYEGTITQQIEETVSGNKQKLWHTRTYPTKCLRDFIDGKSFSELSQLWTKIEGQTGGSRKRRTSKRSRKSSRRRSRKSRKNKKHKSLRRRR
jgi:hypothetical protein